MKTLFMPAITLSLVTAEAAPFDVRAQELFESHQARINEHTNRVFLVLFMLQWIAGVGASLWISPLSWVGAESKLHWHVLAATILGGTLALLPLLMLTMRPQSAATRHVVAVSQMLFGALFIHLSGGRIETHFHVFGSLAFLALYRDWRVLLSATIVVAVDHFLRGTFWPESVFGVLATSPWRWLEHAGWVLFEVSVLTFATFKGLGEMREIAARESALDKANTSLREAGRELEVRVAQRTSELQSEVNRRLESEQTLRRSEERFRAMIERSSDNITVIDAEGKTLFESPAVESITGYKPEELVGQSSFKLIHGDDVPCAIAAIQRSFAQPGHAEGLTYRIQRKDGSWRVVETIGRAVKGEGGRPEAILNSRDVTERRRAEEKLAHYHGEIEQKNSELDKALAQANEATRLKSEFLANMSHEIRTPMNGVIGMTGLLLETELSREQREYADVIRSSGEALLCIINDILDFSKIEAGKLKLEPVEFDLHEATHDVAELLAKSAQDKGLELLVRYDGACPRRILADPGRIRQILLNLLGNAVKFTSVGHVLVEVSASSGPDAQTVLVKVAVQDTGIGIPADKLPRLFQSFSQADASTTRQFGGTGLGLAISKQLITLMGGTIGVVSDPGKGSIFHFEIPVPMREDFVSDAGGIALPGNLRVLVVDDDEISRRVNSHACASLGTQCVSAHSGIDALAKLRAAANEGKPFDLALIDMRMPVMDGAQLARHIKKDAGISETRIVVVSAHVRPDDSTLPVGMIDAVLTKPLRTSVLLSVVRRMFQRNLKATTTTSRIKPRQGTTRTLVAGKRVLVAEDNAVNQKLAVRMLEKMGCRHDVAANGQEAVKMALSMPFDLVLMDCQMPDMDGYEATREIRRLMGERHVPIIAMTANAMQGDREKCLAAGMDDYISKPMKLDDLREALGRWLGIAPTEQPTPLPVSGT